MKFGLIILLFGWSPFAFADVINRPNSFGLGHWHDTGANVSYFLGHVYNTPSSMTGGNLSGTMYTLPFWVGRPSTISTVQFYVGAAGGTANAKCQLCFYNNAIADGTLYPNALVADGGEDLTGIATGARTFTLNYTFGSDQVYWAGLLCTGTTPPQLLLMNNSGTTDPLGATFGVSTINFSSLFAPAVTYARPCPAFPGGAARSLTNMVALLAHFSAIFDTP